jgi:hypothetical protein
MESACFSLREPGRICAIAVSSGAEGSDMTGRMLAVGGLILLLAAPGLASAGEVRLSIKDGRVALVARDATLREILIEWERVGGTRIVNRDRVPGTRLTLELPDVTEEQALTTLLRPIAGYVASRRVGIDGGASGFSRIILMAAPATYAAAAPGQAAGLPGMATQPGGGGPPFGRPGMQRRVLPDGRVVTVMDDSQRMGEPDDPDEAAVAPTTAPGLMRPPFNAPQRPQGQGESTGAGPDLQPADVAPPTANAPVVPVTVGKPGALPATRPGAVPALPIKPPGD